MSDTTQNYKQQVLNYAQSLVNDELRKKGK